MFFSHVNIWFSRTSFCIIGDCEIPLKPLGDPTHNPAVVQITVWPIWGFHFTAQRGTPNNTRENGDRNVLTPFLPRNTKQEDSHLEGTGSNAFRGSKKEEFDRSWISKIWNVLLDLRPKVCRVQKRYSVFGYTESGFRFRTQGNPST